MLGLLPKPPSVTVQALPATLQAHLDQNGNRQIRPIGAPPGHPGWRLQRLALSLPMPSMAGWPSCWRRQQHGLLSWASGPGYRSPDHVREYGEAEFPGMPNQFVHVPQWRPQTSPGTVFLPIWSPKLWAGTRASAVVNQKETTCQSSNGAVGGVSCARPKAVQIGLDSAKGPDRGSSSPEVFVI